MIPPSECWTRCILRERVIIIWAIADAAEAMKSSPGDDDVVVAVMAPMRKSRGGGDCGSVASVGWEVECW